MRTTPAAPRLRALAAAILALLGGLAAPARASVRLVSEAADGLIVSWQPAGRELVPIALPPGTRPDVATPGVRVEDTGWAGRVRLALIAFEGDAALGSSPRQVEIRFAPAGPEAPALPPALWRDDEIRAAAGRAAPAASAFPEPFINPVTASRALEASLGDPAARPRLPGVAPPGGLLHRRLATPLARGERRAPGLPAGDARPAALTGGRVKITVAPDAPGQPGGPGIYRITHAMLASLGVDPSDIRLDELRLQTFGLYTTGRVEDLEVALRVHDEDGDGLFGPFDWLEFWGEPLTGEDIVGLWQRGDFTDERGYLLDTAPGPRERWTTAGDGTPVSPPSRDWLATARAEVDDLFVGNPRTGEWGVDRYYWCSTQRLRWQSPGGDVVRTESIDLPGLATASARRGAVRAKLLHRLPDDVAANPDWRSVLDLNARAGLSDLTGNGYALVAHEATGLSPATDLLPAGNVVRLHAPGVAGATANLFDLDEIEIDYPRTLALQSGRLAFTHETGRSVVVAGVASPAVTVIDVSDPLRPRVLEGVTPAAGQVAFEILEADTDGVARYAVQEDAAGEPVLQPAQIKFYLDPGLRDPATAADVLVIGPRDWLEDPSLDGLQRWVADREAQGLRVLLASTEDIMDEIGTGSFTPLAVGRTLAVALSTWAVAPRYCLLLGDTTIDYANRIGGVMRDFDTCAPLDDACGFDETAWCQHVPTRMFELPEDPQFLGYYSSDVVAGLAAGGDWYVDVAIGRLPARTAAEAGALLDKVLAHEGLAGSGQPWLSRAVFVADAIDPAEPQEQGFEDFQLAAEAAHVQPPYAGVEMFYQRDYGATNPAGFTQDLLATWSDPASSGAVVSYVGHGAAFRWSSSDLLLNRGTTPCRDDVPQLGGAGLPEPFVLNANCITGTFVHPLSPALLEELVRQPEGGAIAAFGPTGITTIDEAPLVLDAAFGAIHGRTGRGLRLGDAVVRIQLALAVDAPVDPSGLLGSAFLGDPTLVLSVPHGPAARALRAAGGDSLVDLDWDAVPGAVAYNVWRSDAGAGGPFERLASAVTGTTLRDQGDPPGPLPAVVNDRLYHYALEPLDASGWPGRWSAIVPARPCTLAVPQPAGAVTVTPGTCSGTFRLRWTASPTPNLQGYRVHVYRGPSAGGAPERTAFTTGPVANLSGLVNWREYTFVVVPLTWCDVEGPGTAPVTSRVTCTVRLDPPAFVPDLRVTKQGGDVRLDWSPVTQTVRGDALTPVRYDVHRTTAPARVPDAGTLVASPAAPGLTESGRVGNGVPLEAWVVGAVDAQDRVGSLAHDYPQGVTGIVPTDLGTEWELTWAPVRADIRGVTTPIARYVVYASDAPIDRSRVETDPTLSPAAVVTEPRAVIPKVPGVVYFFAVPEDVHGNRSVY